MLDKLHGFDKFHDECGVFALYGHPEAANLTYLGLYALQHRGQESAGIAVADEGQVTVVRDMGLVSQVFNEKTLAGLTGTHAIGHVRYSTTGATAWQNSQPITRSAVPQHAHVRGLRLSLRRFG